MDGLKEIKPKEKYNCVYIFEIYININIYCFHSCILF